MLSGRQNKLQSRERSREKATLDNVVKEGLSENVTFKFRPE